MKSFVAKRVILIWVNLRYLIFKLKENRKNCNTFDHDFIYIPLYTYWERFYYFVFDDGALTFKMSKMALNSFCDKTIRMYWDRLPLSFLEPPCRFAHGESLFGPEVCRSVGVSNNRSQYDFEDSDVWRVSERKSRWTTKSDRFVESIHEPGHVRWRLPRDHSVESASWSCYLHIRRWIGWN